MCTLTLKMYAGLRHICRKSLDFGPCPSLPTAIFVGGHPVNGKNKPLMCSYYCGSQTHGKMLAPAHGEVYWMS